MKFFFHHLARGFSWSNVFGGSGVVFRLNRDGGEYRLLHSFGTVGDGISPQGSLVESADGALYGVTQAGGKNNHGTLFRLDPDGSGYAILHSFAGGTTDGEYPVGLVQGNDGVLYGTTAAGGSGRLGTVFRLNQDGSGYRIVHGFSPYGYNPSGALIEGSDGDLYGSTSGGQAMPDTANAGTVFKLSRDGTAFKILFTFSNDGYEPTQIVEGSDGLLHGATFTPTIFTIHKDGTGYRVLKHFAANGASVWLTEGKNGVLYGTGGSDYQNTLGTAFTINKDGSGYSLLHSFSDDDGSWPTAPLIQGTDGALYGETVFGGSDLSGTVFKLSQDGSKYQVLHEFSSATADGQNPRGGLIEGSDGVLYGTTSSGGGSREGTVFKLNKDGSGYQLLHSLIGNTEGASPTGLIQGQDGALYGTGYEGGPNTYGTVFRLRTDGSALTVLHSFWGRIADDGEGPSAPVIQGRDGVLYGTTERGGVAGAGTIFKMNPDGSAYSVLHSFSIGSGGNPHSGLLEGGDGKLYGLARELYQLEKDGNGYKVLHSFPDYDRGATKLVEGLDGALYGTALLFGDSFVFKINPDASGYVILHSFAYSRRSEGLQAKNGIILGRDGAFYGTALGGGDCGRGTAFKLWPEQTPDMMSATWRTNSVEVRFAGQAGNQYEVQRSTDLMHWQPVRTVVMPPEGTVSAADYSPQAAGTHYRAAWLP